ncbi:hypothetical protein CHT99_18180 [Sphingobacterium cellulitidis]|nr:hypothetical protein CHT99_18180 [Sphingobacterium cellulitidis]
MDIEQKKLSEEERVKKLLDTPEGQTEGRRLMEERDLQAGLYTDSAPVVEPTDERVEELS